MSERNNDYPEKYTAFINQSISDWSNMISSILGENSSERIVWNSPEKIIDVLNIVSSPPVTNHLFFPRSGGLDLEGAATSSENGCIELNCQGSVQIIKPNSLYLETFPTIQNNQAWSYLRLEADELMPSGVYEDWGYDYEELVEVAPEQYIDRTYWDAGYYGHDAHGVEKPLPSHARLVSRYSKGAFVIFAKGSIYNQTNETYDGRHNKMTADQFRAHIERSCQHSNKDKESRS